jgi:hypothetical protein
MKNLKLLSILTGVMLGLNATAQTYTTLVATNNATVSFNVPTNTLAQVIHVTPEFFQVWNTYPTADGIYAVPYVGVTINGNTVYYYQAIDFPAGASTSSTNINHPVVVNKDWPLFTGPATLTLGNPTYLGPVLCTIQTTPVNQVNFTPNNAVVIPSDSNGPVNIIMESSPDMVNWTPALPGTYGTTATNRFFRVRATR